MGEPVPKQIGRSVASVEQREQNSGRNERDLRRSERKTRVIFRKLLRGREEGNERGLLSTNAIVERSLESARVNRESEEGEAIETAIQEVISDAEMQLQNF